MTTVTATLPVSGLLEVEVLTEAGVAAVEHRVGRALSVSWRRRDSSFVGFGLLLWLVVEEVMVEINVADGWLFPCLALNLDFLPPDAEEDETSGEDDEETAGGEAEGEQAPVGGQSGGERDKSQSPLLAELPLTDPAGDITPVVRSGPHCDSLRHGHQVGAGNLLQQHLNINNQHAGRATLSLTWVSVWSLAGVSMVQAMVGRGQALLTRQTSWARSP